ncbi:MAG TPA: TolC family protein [Saprospiraceae bacterium]|nr:TolC family protein [Saprospiraceae bacterium]
MHFLRVFFVLIIFCGSLTAQQDLSLEEAIRTGLENSYTIKIEENDLAVAQNRNNWAIAGKYPAINVNLGSDNGYRYQNNPISFFTEISSYNTGLTPSVSTNLVLFDGYRVRLTKNQLETNERLESGNVAIAVENTIQEIIVAYYQALLQQEQLSVLQEVLELSRDRIRYQEVRQEFGQGGSFDLLQSKDAYLSDSTNYLVQKTNLDNALRNLNLAMGLDELSRRYRLSDELQVPAEDYDVNAIRERVFANNRNLQNAFVNRELAGINTKLQEVSNYPRVTVGGNGSYNWGLSSGEGTAASGESRSINAVVARTLNLGVNITATYTLADWGVRKTNIQNAQLQEVSSQYNIDNLKRNLNLQATNLFATYQNQRDLVALTEELVQNARQNLTIAEERFKGGLINSFDYRAVQLAFINAEQSRLNAVFNLKTTETDLIRLMGGLVR